MENTDLNRLKPSKTDQPLEKLSHDTGKTFGQFTSSLRQSTHDYTQKGKRYINENPNKSLAISAVAGAVVGSLITMASRRQK